MHLLILLIATTLTGITSSLVIDPPELGSPCGAELGDCPSMTCIPLSAKCTRFRECPGTCQDLTTTKQQIYTICGGWYMMDDCDERIESCSTDPRNTDSCGPSCDGLGICAPVKDVCEGETGLECGEGKVCFGGNMTEWKYFQSKLCIADDRYERGVACGGMCLPLRFGSDQYKKSKEVEVIRVDQDGYQKTEDGS